MNNGIYAVTVHGPYLGDLPIGFVTADSMSQAWETALAKFGREGDRPADEIPEPCMYESDMVDIEGPF